MSIVINITNSKEMEHTTFATVGKIITYDATIIDNDVPEICDCKLTRCGYENIVFGNLDSINEYYNDNSSFIFKVDDTLYVLNNIITLVDSNENEYIIDVNNNIYGITPIYDYNNIYVGVKVNWRTILLQLGSNKYYFKFKIANIIGTEKEFYSIDYRLYNYTYELAKNTIKLDWINNGVIENWLNFTGINLKCSIRISGKLNYLADTLIIDEYENVKHKSIQIQSKISKNYEFITNLIPKTIGDILTNEISLSNYISITTYNENTYLKTKDELVVIKEINDFIGNYNSNKLGYFKFKMSNLVNDTIKRNVSI